VTTNLWWRPSVPPPPAHTFDMILRRIVEQHYLHGTLHVGVELELGKEDIPFFEGVQAGARQNPTLAQAAHEVVTAIREHGSIIVWTGTT
jgi:hypothetical protein